MRSGGTYGGSGSGSSGGSGGDGGGRSVAKRTNVMEAAALLAEALPEAVNHECRPAEWNVKHVHMRGGLRYNRRGRLSKDTRCATMCSRKRFPRSPLTRRSGAGRCGSAGSTFWH